VRLSERDDELGAFDRILAEAVHGRGAVVLVNGAIGIGKTALLQAMAERAAPRGGSPFLVTATGAEQPHPFGVLERLTRSLCAAGMAEPFPGRAPGGSGLLLDSFAAMDRVWATIRDFAGQRALVLGIDDVHFADEQSMRFLHYLIQRVDDSGVVVILTERSSYERETAAPHATMLALPHCHLMRLEPLTASGIAEQMAGRFGAAPAAASVLSCVDLTGGSPLLLSALLDDFPAGPSAAVEPGPSSGRAVVRALHRDSPGTAAVEPGPSLGRAVVRALHRDSPGTAAVARAKAVLGRSATEALIADLLAVDVTRVREELLELGAMGLLAGDRFRHEHIRRAVLTTVPLGELHAMHGRAAELLHESGASAPAVARQLIAARDGTKAPWRVAIMAEAARLAMAEGDAARAVASLRHAAAFSADEQQRAQIGVLVADAEWHTDPTRAARRLPDLGRDARAGLLTGRDLLLLVDQLTWWGHFAEADDLLRLPGTGSGDGEPALGRLWRAFRRAGLTPGSGADGRAADGRAADGRAADGRASPDYWPGTMTAITYVTAAMVTTYEGAEPGGAGPALHGVHAGTAFTPALYDIVLLLRTGRAQEALRWSDRLLDEKWIARVPMRRAIIEMIRALAALRAGAPAEALRLVRGVLVSVPAQVWGIVAGLPLSIAVTATTELGLLQHARSYLSLPVPPTMFDTPFALPYLQSLGRYRQAVGHPQVTLAELTHHDDEEGEKVFWRNERAAVLRVLGMIRPIHEVAMRTRTTSGEARGRADATPFRNHGPEAEQPTEADQPHDERDVAAIVRGARLTHAERRVAVLAAAGNTNRQIAEQLSVTVSTIEQHLTKIYRKLNVRSRSGLAARLRRQAG
jgi:DNA-binding CsgD family transcriptional regulator